MRNAAIALASRALDLVLPPLCFGCRAPVGQLGALCGGCWQKLTFIAAPHCRQCGVPFEIELGETLACDACLDTPPLYDRARAPLVYNDESRKLILRFKHADALHLAKSFVPLMHTAGRDILARADLLLPVPLARSRLWRRRYNQSAELVRHLATATNIAADMQLLQRTRATRKQNGLTRKERAKNVKGAFTIPANRAGDVQGRTVVLVDDVLTSGATVNECTRVLYEAGAKRVDVLTVARVPLQFGGL